MHARTFHEYMQFRAPPSFREAVQEAAKGKCISVSAYLRAAACESMKRDGIKVSEADSAKQSTG